MYQEYSPGWIEVITGPMFAGKSEELIRRVRTLSYTKKSIITFKPKIDDRYSPLDISSHAGNRYKAFVVSNVEEMVKYLDPLPDVVAIDEVQFFTRDLVGLLEQLANKGTRVIVAGLDLDFRGEPFSFMPELLARAEFVTKLSAACTICGGAATRTQRLCNGMPALYESPIIQVGAKESYEARCRHHHSVPHE